MSHRSKLLAVSILVILSVSLFIATVSIFTLYSASFDAREGDLVHTVRSQARLMEAVAQVDLAVNNHDPVKATAVTLGQFVDAHAQFEEFGETGEFTLAKRDGDRIVFLLDHRHGEQGSPQPVPWTSDLAEPMRRALSGQSGKVLGLDYRGVMVLAAHEPVGGLNWGVVAKMDLAEVRRPFIRAGLMTALGAFLIILVGAIMVVRVSNPVIDRLQEVEASVRESEKRFQLVVEASPSAMVMVNSEGTILLVNAETERLFGQGREDLLGEPVEALIPERFRGKHPRHRTGFFAHPEPRRMGAGRDLHGLSSDGTEFPVEVGLNPIETEEGWLVLSSIVDISERKQAEEALRKAHDELEEKVQERTALLSAENSDRKRAEQELQQRARELAAINRLGHLVGASLSLDQLVQAAIDGIVTVVAPDVALFFLREGERLRLRGFGPNDSKFSHQETSAHVVGECLCGLAAREGQPTYSSDIHSDPRCTWSECKKAGLRSFAALPLRSGNEILGVLGLASGTERDFRAQAAFLETLAGEIAICMQNALLYDQVHRHAVELEEKVTKRTAELAAAKDRAEAADRLKSAFLATMSHELRTPLNSIIGFTGIILQGLAGPLSEEQTKQLGMVQGSSRHLLSLINDILDLSKIEADQLEVTSAPFDLPQAIQKVVEAVSPLADTKGLVLRTRVSPQVGRLVGDRRRVEQILINLANNAIKFTEKGEVRVECEVVAGRVVIQVADTGIGIKPEDLGGLFEPFRQVDDRATERQYKGTGLGLAISRKLARMLGGDVQAESRWAAGSTFTLTLPLVTGEGTP